MEGPFVSAMRGDRCGAYESGTGVDVSTSGIVAGVAGATVQCHHPACHPRQVRVCIRQPLDLLQGGHPEWQLDNTAAHLRRCDGRLHVAQRLADILYSIWSQCRPLAHTDFDSEFQEESGGLVAKLRGSRALAPLMVMLAYLRSVTLLALALFTVVVADAGAPAYLAHAPLAVMLAYLRPATLLALALFTAVGADAWRPRMPCTGAE